MTARSGSAWLGQNAGGPVTHCWPTMGHSSLPQSSAAVRAMIRSMGHDADDFRVSLAPVSWLHGLLGRSDRFIAVRRLSSGCARLYCAGAHSPWLAELLTDIESGAFGK